MSFNINNSYYLLFNIKQKTTLIESQIEAIDDHETYFS